MAVTAEQLAKESLSPLPDADEIERADRVLAVATQMVNDYSPNAPDVLKDEAVIRFGGYLLGSDYGAIVDETLGPMSQTYAVNHAAAFRNCGAAMLLTRYRVRRAGAIG